MENGEAGSVSRLLLKESTILMFLSQISRLEAQGQEQEQEKEKKSSV